MNVHEKTLEFECVECGKIFDRPVHKNDEKNVIANFKCLCGNVMPILVSENMFK